MNRFIFLLSLIILVFLASLSLAGIPKMINYQGMLTGSNGTTPVPNGNYNLTFKIYGSESGTDSLWREYHSTVLVTNGLFNVILGSITSLNLPFDTTYWLGIKVGTDPELTPRIQLTSVGYAYRAAVSDSAIKAISAGSGGGWTDDGSVVRLTTVSDNVGIGTASPTAKLDVNGDINTSSFYEIGGSRMLSNPGTDNIFVGVGAGSNNTGTKNTFLGAFAGSWYGSGSGNTFLGNAAGMYNTSGGNNTFVGVDAGKMSTGSENVFIGTSAGVWNTTGNFNTYLGSGAGLYNSKGVNNTFLGCQAGFNDTGSGNVFIGYQAGVNDTGSNKLYIANGSADPPLIYGDFSTGYIGLGTTSPSRKLHIVGVGPRILIEASSGNPEVNFQGAGDTGTQRWALYKETISGDFRFYQNGDKVTIQNSTGNVGIGTSSPAYKLDVNGDINVMGSYNIRKNGTAYNHPDYVFEPDYKLMPLDELKKYVSEKKCLPNVISAEDVQKNNGFKMDELLIQMLEKIEEQTLYIIQLEERIAKLEKERR